jgi:multiple sugar transport system substrate-binding protein
MTFTFTRTLTTGVALSTGALLLAGCGIGDSPGDATTPAESTGEVEVVWKGDADRAASIQEALDLFNEANPDVKITTDYQSGGEYMQKMTIRFASGDAPDLMRQERETLRDYADRGVLLDLSGMDEIDTSAIPESVLESGKVDDKLYGITEASGGDVYGVDIPMGEISNLGIWLRQHGEDLWDADGKPAFTAATVQEWFEMYLHAVEVGAQPAPDALDAIGAAADQSSLGQGFIAIGSIPTNSYAVFNDVAGGGLELGYYPGESEADQRGQQVIPALYWSIAASSGDASDAAKVLDFIVNDPEGAALLGSTHGQPANADVATSMADTQSEDDKIAFDEIIKLSELDLTAPVPDPAGSAELREELSGIGDQVKFGQITPEDGAQAFVDAAASILGE